MAVCAFALWITAPSLTQPKDKGKKPVVKGPLPTSYDQVSPVLLGKESFDSMRAKDKAAKAAPKAATQAKAAKEPPKRRRRTPQ